MHPRSTAQVGRREQAFAMVALILLAGGVFPLLQKDSTGDASTLSFAALSICCIAAGTILHQRGEGILAWVSRIDVAAVLLLGVIALSTFWSDQPGVTARRAVAVLLYTVFGLYLLDRFSLSELPWLLARACAIAALASIAVAVLMPRWGHVPGSGGEWRGIFVQKNVLGRFMAVGVLSSVFSALTSTRRTNASLAIAAVCGLVLARSSSVFAIVSMLTIVAPIVLVLVLRSRFPVRQALVVLIGALCAVSVVLAVSNWDALLASFGRDSGLTGRVQLWTSCWHALLHRPWFGYGYGGFWHGWAAPSTPVYLENPWGPPNAHNGPLDLALGIGLVGAALWMFVVAGTVWRAARALARNLDAASLWPLGVPLLIASYNVTEVTTTGNGFFWALLVAVSTAMCASERAHAARRARSHQPSLRLSAPAMPHLS